MGNILKGRFDIAKNDTLGANYGSMAGQFLKAAAVSTEKAVDMMKLSKRQIEVTMFVYGVEKLEGLALSIVRRVKARKLLNYT